MSQKYTEAKAKANKKWDEANKERKKYISHRARARSFIRDVATLEDLDEFEQLIKKRRKTLEN